MIPLEKIALLKDTATDNIVDVISDFVSLKKKGNIFVGLSPFNNERTPSFTVHKSKGIYKDFSSGKGGDVFDFLMKANDWKYIQALQYIGKKFSIELDNNDFEYIPTIKQQAVERPVSFIHPEVMLYTLNSYENNPLFTYLNQRFDARSQFDKYYVGCNNDWVIFWQIDINTFVRSGKYIKYLNTGKRCKETKASWEHAKTKEYKPIYQDFNLQQCFFGEHLISDDIRKPIAIVESEKTAIVASNYMPGYIWLACGSKVGLNDTKCAVIANRSVTLFPDIGCYDDWTIYAKKYGYSISDKLEKMAKPEHKGLDIADFLL